MNRSESIFWRESIRIIEFFLVNHNALFNGIHQVPAQKLYLDSCSGSDHHLTLLIIIGVRARGWGAAAPLTRAKPLFFGQKLNFSGRSQQPK